MSCASVSFARTRARAASAHSRPTAHRSVRASAIDPQPPSDPSRDPPRVLSPRSMGSRRRWEAAELGGERRHRRRPPRARPLGRIASPWATAWEKAAALSPNMPSPVDLRESSPPRAGTAQARSVRDGFRRVHLRQGLPQLFRALGYPAQTPRALALDRLNPPPRVASAWASLDPASCRSHRRRTPRLRRTRRHRCQRRDDQTRRRTARQTHVRSVRPSRPSLRLCRRARDVGEMPSPTPPSTPSSSAGSTAGRG